MIWLTVSAMLHDLVDCMYVLCCMIWLTVSAMLHGKSGIFIGCLRGRYKAPVPMANAYIFFPI